ncbi:MAG: Holliday junction resolvase RuvX, partial [Rhodospirillales bacterium]|nr:Holliday junction resolvase RuvX [Rhodospirillales bacterium]
MPVVALDELAAPAAGRLLGIDVGSKTLGLALSDETRTIASPLTTLRRGRFREDAAALMRIIGEHAVS